MSSFGLDYVTGPPIADMKAAGVSFVCRYLSYVNNLTQVKLLTPPEAKALSQAGISIVSNYEWYAVGNNGVPRVSEGFASGVQDARIAASQHAACGGPPDRPIYFSVDVDVAGTQCLEYFRGVASVIGASRTGVYGSYRVLNYLLVSGLVGWGWQTYAWSGGQWEPRAHIQQYLNGVSFSGHSVDYNRSIKSDFGQWQVGGTFMIDLSTPGVSNYFTPAQMGWNCRQTGKNIHGAILAFYQTFGQNGLCGLTHLGLPLSNEISLGGTHGAVRQHFENGVVFYDVAHEYDTRPGEPTASVYLAHIYSGPGEDPKIAELESELAHVTQATGIDPTKVHDRLAAIGLSANNGNATIQQLVTQPIS